MFHAMRLAMSMEDGAKPLPVFKLWFRATGPFSTSACVATGQPYAEYNGTRDMMPGGDQDKYSFHTAQTGLVETTADDVLTSVGLAAPSDGDAFTEFASQLTSVDAIGSSVTSLSERAFYGCRRLGPRFEPMYYGPGLALGDGCFESCRGIESFSPRFLSKVTSSGNRTFAHCSSLRTIAGMSAFDPSGAYCFYRCSSLMSLVGGYSSATELGERCFEGCSSLPSLAGLPSTLERMGLRCFAHCTSLSDITALADTALEALSTGCFLRCSSLTSDDCGAGSGITAFGASCFEGCSSLASLAGTPTGLEKASDRCFAESGVASLSGLPGTLKAIGRECFASCDGLTSLEGLPLSVTSIGAGCFRECYGEAHPVEYPPEKPSTEWGLSDISHMAAVLAGWDKPRIGERCFYGDRRVRSLPDMSGLDSLVLGPYAFAGCSGLDSLKGLPEKTSMAEGAFSGCYRGPHDWCTLDENGAPVWRTRVCGLSKADMSHLLTTSLPARCFENCGALAELPPLPPRLMEMGDRCFAGCVGLKSLASLADLDVEVTDGSTYRAGGAMHGPEYPKFGEWCFAGCGTKKWDDSWLYFNDPAHPPTTGFLATLRPGLKQLCDRLELEAVSTMSASAAVMKGLYSFMRDAVVAGLPDVVDGDTFSYVVDPPYDSMWNLNKDDLSVMAGTVALASKTARAGYTLYTKEIEEKLSPAYPDAVAGATHLVIAFLLPLKDGWSQLWFACPGLDADVSEFIAPDFTGTKRVVASYTSVSGLVSVEFTVHVKDGTVHDLYAEVKRGESTVTSAVYLDRTVVPEAVDATGVALSFVKFMLYATAALAAKDGDTAHVSTVPFSVVTSSADSLTDADAALARLRDLSLATPASSMLGAHCFDGCEMLEDGFPRLICDVPPYCFARTAYSSLTDFKWVYSLGTGAFSGAKIRSLADFPKAVAFVSARLFENCDRIKTLGPLPRRTTSFGAYSFSGCTALADLKCDAEGEWTGPFENDLCRELWRSAGKTPEDDFQIQPPPLAAFVRARAVTVFGESCFQSDVSLTDDAMTVEYEASAVSAMIKNVENALASPGIFTSSRPSDGTISFTVVFHLANDANFVVRFTADGEDVQGPPALTGDGESSTEYATSVAEASPLSGENVSFTAYEGDSEGSKVALRTCDGRSYTPSESWDEQSVRPARMLPSESDDPEVVSVSADGYVKLLLETEGRRFAAELSFKVDRHKTAGEVDSATASLTGLRVTDEGTTWPGYPEPGQTARYSAVPCLTTVGASCFEGCSGLGSLDWLPFGVTSLPFRCFAGVPFTHAVEGTADSAPEDSGQPSSTVTANSVVVPPWVTSIGKDCFTFKGFEDAEEKLKALYVSGSPSQIRQMPNFPWGIPPGCSIYSVTGGLVYTEPEDVVD